jgi:hypothetical protein
MSAEFVDWSALTPDPDSAGAVASLGDLAAGFDPQVPAVLLPVRVETRFTTVEVPDPGTTVGGLLDALGRLEAVRERLARRDYATVLIGTVREKRDFKKRVEAVLYAETEDDLAELGEHAEALRRAVEQPVAPASVEERRRLEAAVSTVRRGVEATREAMGQLRSDHERARLMGIFDVRAEQLEAQLRIISRRVLPGLHLVADLGIRPGALAARDLGRTPAGGPLRPGVPRPDLLRPGVPTNLPSRAPRVVLDDGTPAAALGAERLVGLDRTQLFDSAEAAALVSRRLADPTAALDDEIRAAAAGITVLPGALKADLLGRLDRAAGRAGAAEIRSEIEATPSDRLDLDVALPDRPASTVFTVEGPTRTMHQLLVRVYPEPLAVDSHEEGLTETEVAVGQAFWAETAASGSDEELRKGAWRALCVGRSTRRAAWIARVTEPVEPAPTPGAIAAEQLSAAITTMLKRSADIVEPRRGDPRPPPLDPRGPSPLDPTRRSPLDPTRRSPLDPTRRSPLDPTRPPPSDPRKALTERQIVGLLRALRGLEDAVRAAPPLPAASLPLLLGGLQTLRATLEELTRQVSGLPDDWAGLLEELERHLANIEVESVDPAAAPDVETRAGTWTRAASSTVLPHRFAVFLVVGGKAVTVAAGQPVPADLGLGLDPKADTFSLDDDGNLVVPDSIRWMTDFAEAEAQGMALRVTLTPQQAEQGIDELLVLGLCDGDPDDGDARLTAMLDAHHYTGEGLSLLPVGTPTNNTEDEVAGFASSDDPDLAYPVERGASLVSEDGSDGRRLTAALGVDADVLAHVAGADGTDAEDAFLANRVLYPGTLGHALEELVPGLVSRDARERLRSFALGHVTARGQLPAFRVDDQPYGVLAATALSRFVPDLRDSGSEAASAGDRARQQLFEETLVGLLRHLHGDWSAIRAGREGGPGVKHAHSPEIGKDGFDAQQHFLTMLGLEASSVASSYRFAVNVADRGGVRGEPELGLGFGIPPVDGSTVETSAALGPFALMEHLEPVLRTAFGLPADRPRDPVSGKASVAWEPVLDRIQLSRLYGLRLLTGLYTLRGVVAAAPTDGAAGTGSWIQTLLGLTAAELRARTESDISNVGLAELLVRQALLAEERRVAAGILVQRGVLGEGTLPLLGSSSTFQTWSAGSLTRTSSWGVLFSTVDRLAELVDGTAVPGDLLGRTMAEVMASPRPAEVAAHRADVAAFAQLSPDRMTALTREHLDLCSHRLDAWLTGLADRRLSTMRRRRSAGAQVGAYGWVQDLRPKGTLPATGVPASLAGLPGRPLVADPSGEGFIQTPSPTHAVTAAVLRAAYRARSVEGAVGNELSINLSSERVRVALGLVDGVRAGNDLGALLGYRLERFLHEYYARPDTPEVAELDAAIFPLRRAYPTVAAVDPGADALVEPTRYVVDGLALVRTLLAWVETHYEDADGTLFEILWARRADHPWGVKPDALPDRADTPQLEGVLRGIDSIADALDALGDLTTSEAVHQLVRGNHTRAAAVLAALAEGKAIPHPEVVDTPRTGLPVSHRVVVALPPVDADPPVPPPGWEAVPMSPRAALEPTVNAWLASLLGDPSSIRVRLAADRLPPGAALPELSLAALGLQPLDLVALLADGFDSAVGTLTARVLDELRPADLPPDQPGVVLADGPGSTATDTWRIEPRRAAAWGPAIRGITDVAPLLESCADLLGTSRPARASDLAAPEATAVAGDGVDLTDLGTRVQRLLDDARADAVDLIRLLAEDPALDATELDTEPAERLAALRAPVPEDPAAEHVSAWLPRQQLDPRLDAFWAQREAWRSAARAAQAYGVRVGLPRRFLSRTQVSTELLQSAEVAFLDLATRCRTASATLTDADGSPTLTTWVQVAEDLLGEGLVLVPRIGLDPVRTDLQAGLDAELVAAGDLDAWLEGAAAVRPGAAVLADVQVLAEALGRLAPAGSVAQLPHADGDPWLGGPVPDAAALSGKVSLAVFSAGAGGGGAALPAAGETGSLLLVDEWSETVPHRDEVTGVALHYDQPDSTAPQAVLVAVPPVLGQKWTLTDFAATLHDTLEVASNRTVELEHVGAGRYGQLLPLVVGEVVPHAARQSVAGDRVILDFHQNNPS